MPKILVAECKQEVASFNPILSHQERFYKAWAARLINVDAPGATSANLKSLGHTRCPRPMFPLDENVAFAPRAKLFCSR